MRYEVRDGGRGFANRTSHIPHTVTFMKTLILIGFPLLGISLAQIDPAASWPAWDSPNRSTSAASENQYLIPEPWNKKIEAEFGGHVKVRGSISWPDDESFFQPVGTDPCYDGNAGVRLMSKLFFGKWGIFETHYENVLSGSDTRRKMKTLDRLYPDLFEGGLTASQPLEDDRRFMDLTKTIDEDESYIWYHRLDRLFLTLLPRWGVISIGRQAVTWGNGLLFNPMDLFNPFPPTDIERDYKIGDDMVFTQFSVDRIGDFQFLYVPRRDPVSQDVEWDQSSLAGKLHFAHGTTEFDIMAAAHYKDTVVGFGSTGYLGNAAWRLDGVWTFLDEDRGTDSYLSLVANIDYSWVWWEKNFYGFLEFYFNGLGDNNYTKVFTDPDISEGFQRGELYTLGRTYLSGSVRMELHPLFNIYLTVINNLANPSGIVQPRAVWDIAEDLQITFGGNIYYGRRGTEYGGFTIPGTTFLYKAPDRAFLWLTYFF